MTKQFILGERLNGTINNVTDLGLFVTFDKKHSGLVHRSDFSDWSTEQKDFAVGQEVRVVITNVADSKLSLSLSKVNSAELADPTNQFNDVAPTDFYNKLSDVVVASDDKINKLKKKIDGQ